MTSKFFLPSKIVVHLQRLLIEYDQLKTPILSEIIRSSKVLVHQETTYDNWNGGTYGHSVQLFLPKETFTKIRLKQQEEYCEKIRQDLSVCSKSVEGEFYSRVFLDLAEDGDWAYQEAISILGQPHVNPDTLSIWKPGHIRLFISHRDTHKVAARFLADALGEFGISSFVAHDTIEPLTSWQDEILNGLQTMEVMLAFMTDDFYQSYWTNQELGFALGRSVPIIPLKLQKQDPSGFLSKYQALRGSLDEVESSVPDIYQILSEKLGNKARLQSALITAFINSADFLETKKRFDRLDSVVKTLSEDEVALIIQGFAENTQLHNAVHLTSKYQRLSNFLKRTTGCDYEIQGSIISLLEK